MPRGGKGILWHSEAYEGPDTPFKPGVQEVPTLTCIHCGVIVILNPERRRDRHFCYKCDHYVCDKPGCIINCNPWMRTVEAGMARPELQPLMSLQRGNLGEMLHDQSMEDFTRPYALGAPPVTMPENLTAPEILTDSGKDDE